MNQVARMQRELKEAMMDTDECQRKLDKMMAGSSSSSTTTTTTTKKQPPPHPPLP